MHEICKVDPITPEPVQMAFGGMDVDFPGVPYHVRSSVKLEEGFDLFVADSVQIVPRLRVREAVRITVRMQQGVLTL